MESADASRLVTGPRARPRVRERLLLAVFAGGVVGALLRAALEQALPAPEHGWPWATFAVNVAGAALLAYAATQLQERVAPSTYPRPLLGTGLCGALTTFSTLQIELIALFRNGEPVLAAGYLVASVAAGLLVVQAVTALVRRGPVR